MKWKLMHIFLLLMVAAAFNFCGAQKPTEELKPVDKLPEGTYILEKSGTKQLKVMGGYVATVSADNKLVTIAKGTTQGSRVRLRAIAARDREPVLLPLPAQYQLLL